MVKKIGNPLIRRLPRELIKDWRKYLIVSVFLILVIGFVSGMYVANESMVSSVEAGKAKYILEDGHFELSEAADDTLINAVSTGEKADIKAFYISKARAELDERFDSEFSQKFKDEFDAEFPAEFDKAYSEQIKSALEAQGLSGETLEGVLESTMTAAKSSPEYASAYDEAYDEAYSSAYSEAYNAAYDEAWSEIESQIDEEYAEAEEKYSLDDPDFSPVPVKVCENYFRNEEEDYNSDCVADGTVRVYKKTDDINLAGIIDGRLPETADEIAVDRMHADNVGISVGQSISVGGKSFKVVGLIAYVNYSTLHEKATDMIFDALKFNVAMVTDEGFERLESEIHYSYAWQYLNKPADEKQEKALSDDFLPALLTQTVAAENELVDYLPKYANPAINFAANDMGSDMAMGGTLLYILIIIIAFIFGITVSSTIASEARTIGTLRASGYTRGELIRHYLAMPVIVTLFSAAVGNILGYTLFKNVVVSMYYNSYSLPAYETVWSPDAFIRTTAAPVILTFLVNLAIISLSLRISPLRFLRGELKKSRRKKAVRLPDWKFIGRYRMRNILQNMPNYVILIVGVFFVQVLLAMAVGMPQTLDYYKENAADMMFAKYQYVLKSCDGEDEIEAGAERFCMKSLQRKSEVLNEEISVYGIEPGSSYVGIDGLAKLKPGEAYISESYRGKYGVSLGDVITLDERYENKKYDFTVAGFYDKSISIAVFLPIDGFREVFGLEKDEFTGYLSDTELKSIDSGSIATVITERDITKMCDQLDHSMGAYMEYFQVLCILLSAVMIYLLTKVIIEKNESAISMIKILGYENGEIARLYILSTAIVLIIADIACALIGSAVMSEIWQTMLSKYSGWYAFRMNAWGYAKMILFVLIGYVIVTFFDFRRIKKIPLERALKNAE